MLSMKIQEWGFFQERFFLDEVLQYYKYHTLNQFLKSKSIRYSISCGLYVATIVTVTTLHCIWKCVKYFWIWQISYRYIIWSYICYLLLTTQSVVVFLSMHFVIFHLLLMKEMKFGAMEILPENRTEKCPILDDHKNEYEEESVLRQ